MSIFSELGVRGGKERVKEETLYNLVSCYGLIENRLERFLSSYGLSPVKMNALMMIKHVGGMPGLSQAEIGKRMIVTAGNITRLIDRLEREGLAERVLQPKDRRVRRIRITQKGSDLLDKVWPVYIKEVDRILSVLPAREAVTVNELLGKVRKGLLERKEGPVR